MGGAAGLVGRCASSASGIVFAPDTYNSDEILAFVPTSGAKANFRSGGLNGLTFSGHHSFDEPVGGDNPDAIGHRGFGRL